MGLIDNIIISLVHIILIATDMLFIVMVLKIVYDRWEISWIKPILTAAKPVTEPVLDWFYSLTLRITGRSFQENTLLPIMMICLMVLRFVVVSIVRIFVNSV